MTVRRDMQLAPREQALKNAFRALVEACGGLEPASHYCRVGKTKLSDYCSINTDGFAAADVVADLEAVTAGSPQHPQVTRVLARRAGFTLLPIPDGHAPDTVWSGFAGRLAKEGGELISSICSALADDNDVSPAEARRAIPEAEDLLDLVAQTLAALRTRAETRR